jgi:beta-N-acetylhexosaminidase
LIARSSIALLFSLWLGGDFYGQRGLQSKSQLPDSTQIFASQQQHWADSVLAKMSLEEKVGQLFIIAAYSNQGEGEYNKVVQAINRYNVGGLIFMQGSPAMQAKLTNRYQNASMLPLIISVDGEWGLGMRLKNTINYPRNLTLGAIQNDSLLYKTGQDMASQMARLGIHMNFAPSADVNTNAANPVIGFRSFGDNKTKVANKASAVARGLQNAKVIASAKHFPGHGHSGTDSHYSLPTINKTYEELLQNELYPFEKLIKDSVMCILAGHLSVPALDNSGQPSSLSKNVITDLLKEKLGFKGIILTDALNMQGTGRASRPEGEIELMAYQAGHDMLLMPDNLAAGYARILAYVKAKPKADTELNERVYKILKAKYWLGLHKRPHVVEVDLERDINLDKYKGHIQNLYENALTVVSNTDGLLPIKSNNKLVAVAIGADIGNTFQKTLLRFAPAQLFANESRSDDAWYSHVLKNLDSSQTVVVSLHRMSWWPSRRFNVSPTTISFVNKLQKKCKVILVVLGNPYALKYFQEQRHVVCGYEDDPLAQEAAAQGLFGAIAISGRLPVNATNLWPEGTGANLPAQKILAYGMPEAVGMNAEAFANFERIINSAISQKIIPGCNLLIARHGRVVYTNAFGHLQYEALQKTNLHTVYDLASVTKVAATLQAIIKLYDEKKLDLSKTVVDYLPELDSSNKANLSIENILLHQAGLHGYLPFWQNSVENGQLKVKFYREEPTDDYKFPIAKNLYGNQQLKDSLWRWVVNSELISRRSRYGAYPYLYSDLGLIILQKIVERISQQPLDEYCSNSFYKPLALEHTGFNPLQQVEIQQIAPTENDMIFRHRQLRGTVQDQHAAMLGGVAGHAGLFGTIYDLAKILQMNLNGGEFNGIRFFADSSLAAFTRKGTVKSRRALGWDRLPDNHDSHYISSSASPESYGHSGYTGTMVWVDPKYDLIFVFLTNRVHPNANNNKLNTLKIRRRIHDVVYQAIIDK